MVWEDFYLLNSKKFFYDFKKKKRSDGFHVSMDDIYSSSAADIESASVPTSRLEEYDLNPTRKTQLKSNSMRSLIRSARLLNKGEIGRVNKNTVKLKSNDTKLQSVDPLQVKSTIANPLQINSTVNRPKSQHTHRRQTHEAHQSRH